MHPHEVRSMRVVAALGVIVAIGALADIAAGVTIIEKNNLCYVCLDGGTCNWWNADYKRGCDPGDEAECDYDNVTGQFTSDCVPPPDDPMV